MTVDYRRIRQAVVATLIGAALAAPGYAMTRSLTVATLILAISALMAVTVPTGGSVRYSLSLAAVAATPLVLLNRDELEPLHAIVVLVLGSLGSHIYLATIGKSLRANISSLGRHLVDALAFLAVFALLPPLYGSRRTVHSGR